MHKSVLYDAKFRIVLEKSPVSSIAQDNYFRSYQ